MRMPSGLGGDRGLLLGIPDYVQTVRVNGRGYGFIPINK